MARLAKGLKKKDKHVRIMVLNPDKQKNKTWDRMPTLKSLLKKKNIFI